MIIFFYNLIFLICFLIALPFMFIFVRGKELKSRLGFNKGGDKGYLWIHCASVGEVNAVKPLLITIKERNNQNKILLTTMTVTGLEVAKGIKEVDEATLLPFDIILLYLLFLKRYKPQLLIIVETELWFSLLTTARLAKLPVFIVNGRISDKTYSRYQLIKYFAKKDFGHISFVGAQSEENKKRYLSLGFNNVHNTHNLKFCTQLPEINREIIRAEWNLKPDDFILVWGSSREGEEELLLSIHKGLKGKIPNLKIIIAPRHLNRLQQIKERLKQKKYTLLSEMGSNTTEEDIIIIDSIGKLIFAYAIADIAVVGGSFFDFGGHNPLEPLFYEVATIIGPFHSSCSDLVGKLIDNKGIIVSHRTRLMNDILKLSANDVLRNNFGNRGKQVIANNACSVQENLSYIEKHIDLENGVIKISSAVN